MTRKPSDTPELTAVDAEGGAEESSTPPARGTVLRRFFDNDALSPGRTPKAEVVSDAHDWTSHGDDSDGGYFDRLASDLGERDLTQIFRHDKGHN